MHIDTATDVRQLLWESIGLDLRCGTAVADELSVTSVWVPLYRRKLQMA
jgi:hypothetical protein